MTYKLILFEIRKIRPLNYQGCKLVKIRMQALDIAPRTNIAMQGCNVGLVMCNTCLFAFGRTQEVLNYHLFVIIIWDNSIGLMWVDCDYQ